MLKKFINTQSFYQEAKTLLSEDVYSFIEGGSLDELALRRNRQSFSDILLSPRVLRGLSEVSTKFKLEQHEFAAPILIAPSAYQQLLTKNGELDMLAAANQFNIIMILSMFSSIDYSLIAQHKKIPVWLQMYFLKDREINKNFIQLAEELKFAALVITVDTPVYAKRERENTQPLKFPTDMNFTHLKQIGIPIDDCIKTKKHFSTLLDHRICWKDLDWLASNTQLPIFLKGIIDTRDTEIALTYPNVKGIIVSNHGGRQLDSCFAPMDVIYEHKKIVGNKMKIFLDGGINRGSDIFKALALGADATLVGRTALWALAVGGSEGVFQALSILQEELLEVMTLCGCSTLNDITPEFLTYKAGRK